MTGNHARTDFERGETLSELSKLPSASQHAGWKHDKRSKQLNHSFDRDPDQSEREEEKPDNREENQRQERQGPGENEQNQPEQKGRHQQFTSMSEVYVFERAMLPEISRRF
jgi:hypothetical protein